MILQIKWLKKVSADYGFLNEQSLKVVISKKTNHENKQSLVVRWSRCNRNSRKILVQRFSNVSGYNVTMGSNDSEPVLRFVIS